MPTPEELAAAEKAAKEKEAAEKAEADKKAAEEAKKQKDFESWLAGQPENVRGLYNEHVNGLKSALEKEREAAKGNKAALEKLAKYEQDEEARKKAAMTETERLQKERDDALKSANELKTKQAQRDAAEKAGLPATFADRIKGATPEEMETDAKLLLEAMPKGIQRKPPPPPSSPADGLPQTATDADRRKFLFGSQS